MRLDTQVNGQFLTTLICYDRKFLDGDGGNKDTLYRIPSQMITHGAKSSDG